MSVIKSEELTEKLFAAVNGDDISEVQNLLNSGAYPNAVDQTGRAPLHYAALRGNEKIILLLIEAGANIDQGIVEFSDVGPEMTGYTPLDQAAWHERYNIVEKLILYGADIDVSDSLGNTLLMRAIQFGHNLLAEKLIQLGADINAVNFTGRTALHIAVEQTNRAMTKLLTERGTNIIADQWGNTPIDLGARNGLDILIKKIQQDNIISKTKTILNKIFKLSNKDKFEISVIPNKTSPRKKKAKLKKINKSAIKKAKNITPIQISGKFFSNHNDGKL